MIIAVYGNRRQDGHIDGVCALMKLLRARASAPLVVVAKFYDYLEAHRPGVWADGVGSRMAESMPPQANVAVSIGGDGTFLRTVQWVGGADIPILGINTGHLGYLADLSLGEALQAGPDFLFKVEERSVLQVSCTGCGLPDGLWPYALNEVAVLKKDISSMIFMRACVGESFLTNYLADGLIISTPTGSTGYALSVGGPIVAPGVQAVVVAPVAPHSLTMRPLVLADGGEIEVTTDCRTESYLLSLDGRSVSMDSGTTVKVSRAPFTVKVIQRADHHFASTLRDKLLWGETRADR